MFPKKTFFLSPNALTTVEIQLWSALPPKSTQIPR